MTLKLADAATSTNSSELWPSELRVLKWLAEGKTAQEVGLILEISAQTVKNHTHRIIEKLGATNAVQAAVIAVRRGII